MLRLLPFPFLAACVGLTGCIHVKMDPIKVHAVVDVNVRMEKAVADVLSDIYGDSATVNTAVLGERAAP
jgi:hypothetical protein